MAYMRLGEVLIKAGAITEEQLQKALNIQKDTKERLGAVLVKKKMITEQQLIGALTQQLGIDFIDLTKNGVSSDMAQVIPKSIARQYQVVPVQITPDEIYLAMADPMNFYAIEEVKKAVHKRVIPMVATTEGIERTIQNLYGTEGAAKALDELNGESSSELGDAAFTSNQLGNDDDVDAAPTVRLVNSIIERAISDRASDIHMEPREREMVVRMRIDGVMREVLTVPKNAQNSVISRVKVMSNLNIAERRIPQDGRFNVRMRGKDIDLRISTLPTVYGEKVVARLLDKSGGNLSKDAIGLVGDDLRKYENMIKCTSGVILITGPTGSGKSTTMYTIIGELNTSEVNMVTLEDPVEYNVDQVNQVQINEKTGMTFASGLRSILRQDPDIIAVGEIRDGETADIAMRAAITGHVVISTIHTNDSVGTLERLKDIGVEPYLISSAMRGVISQRLVRRICPNCKTKYNATPEEKAELGLPEETPMILYKGVGCPMCFNTGYKGRIAVFEMLPIAGKVRRMIIEGASRSELEAYLKTPEADFVSMRQNALRLVNEGTTTLSEILRVTQEDN